MTTGPFTTAMPQQQLLPLKIATRTSSNSHLPTQYKKQPQLLPNPSQLGGREAECYKAVYSPAGGRIWEHLTPPTEGQINAILEEHRSIALWLPYFIYKIFPFTGSEQFLFHAVKVRSTANNIFFWKLPSFSLSDYLIWWMKSAGFKAPHSVSLQRSSAEQINYQCLDSHFLQLASA